MTKRKDHHSRIIAECRLVWDIAGYKIIEFHTAQKMPRPLRGVPDLNLQRFGFNWWIEVKPRYANYMRDQMSDLQWMFFHQRYGTDFDFHNRYAIVTDAQEAVTFVDKVGPEDPFVWMPDYHWDRYDKWRRGR